MRGGGGQRDELMMAVARGSIARDRFRAFHGVARCHVATVRFVHPDLSHGDGDAMGTGRGSVLDSMAFENRFERSRRTEGEVIGTATRVLTCETLGWRRRR